jgi:hypothetical protein
VPLGSIHYKHNIRNSNVKKDEESFNPRELLVPEAQRLIDLYRPKFSQCLTNDRQCWDVDIAPIWAKMTPEERAWYVLFMSCTPPLHNWAALRYIAPSFEVEQRVYKDLYTQQYNMANDIANMTKTRWETVVEELRVARMLQEAQGKNPRMSRYGPEDIAGDGIRQASTQIRFPGYIKPVAPVKHLTPEEYSQTKVNKRGPNHAE